MNRSQSQSKDRVRLTVRAANHATEIFLVDSGFRRIASDVGRLETEVVPGIYKVRFRSGQSQVDRLIEVESGAGSKIFDGPAVEFVTAVPIKHTITTRKDHQDAARELSRSVKRKHKHGSGSRIYLFVRELIPESAAKPWPGVSLHTIDGNLLAELHEGECAAHNEFCGLNLEVSPGTYRLRVEVDTREVYEMFIVAIEGWQTQVFALVEDFSPLGGELRRASLPTASIFMSEVGQGFDPTNDSVRQVELVRLGLMSGRKVLTQSEIKRRLEEQSLNPMLGIFGAHLLIRQRRIDYALVREMIDTLGEPFASHPDIQALLLNRKIAKSRFNFRFSTPPMLRSSWQFIVHASRRRMSLVPQGSLSDRVADGLLYTAPWLIHRLEGSRQEETQKVSFAESSRQFQRLITLEPQQQAELKTKLEQLQSANQFTPLEQNVITTIITRSEFSSRAIEKQPQQSEIPSVTRALRSIDAPNYAIARATHNIIDKLKED